jgi:hypothetical protein
VFGHPVGEYTHPTFSVSRPPSKRVSGHPVGEYTHPTFSVPDQVLYRPNLKAEANMNPPRNKTARNVPMNVTTWIAVAY